MAEFKGFHYADETDPFLAELRPETVTPLFEPDPAEPPRDFATQGGLIVLSNGSLAEVYSVGFAHDGKTDLASRTTILPYKVAAQQDGMPVILPDESRIDTSWDPRRPSLGAEYEIAFRHDGLAYRICRDGIMLVYPSGLRERLEEQPLHLQPEAYQYMLEWGTPVAHGWQEHGRNLAEKNLAVALWAQEHDLTIDHLSVHADSADLRHFSQQSYVTMMGHLLRAPAEFGVLSSQLHVERKSFEAMAHALTVYQGFQALFNFITSAAPIRDSRFETTIAEHYPANYVITRLGASASEQVLAPDDLLRHAFDESRRQPDGSPGVGAPYDWREMARILGSAGAGALERVPPQDHLEFLRQADSYLRDGLAISVTRSFGSWHSDRMRDDKNTGEICNLGTAGGNFYKLEAVHEVVSKFLVALQEWATHPATSAEAAAQQRERAIEIAHINNMFAGFSGRETNLLGMELGDSSPHGNRQVISYANMLERVVDFIAQHSPEPVSITVYNELAATLRGSAEPELPLNITPEEAVDVVFGCFFSRGSGLTANEALRLAHQRAPNMPVSQLLMHFSDHQTRHSLQVAAEHRIPVML